MAKLALVHCRICKKAIDRMSDTEEPWVMPSRNYFYHARCLEEAEANKKIIRYSNTSFNEKDWKKYLMDYLSKEIKMEINYSKISSQWKNFIKQGLTPKGIYFAIRYFYDCLNGDKTKAQGGIGIVTSIYDESCNYWEEKERKEKINLNKLQEQLSQDKPQEKQYIFRENKKKTSNMLELSSIFELEDDVE